MKDDRCCFSPKQPKDVDREWCLACQKVSGHWCSRAKCPKCPDFDDECFDVEDKHTCWLGTPPTYFVEIGEVIWMPTAKGYCPFLRGLTKA